VRAARREESVSFAMGSRFVSRLRFLATISLANVVVIYTTVFSDWTLREAGLAYAGEWLILMLVVYARVLIAKRLPGESNSGGRRWPLLYAKAMAILVTLLMNGPWRWPVNAAMMHPSFPGFSSLPWFSWPSWTSASTSPPASYRSDVCNGPPVPSCRGRSRLV
jgi:hypothetical protein